MLLKLGQDHHSINFLPNPYKIEVIIIYVIEMDELSNFRHIILIKTTFENLVKARGIANYALNPIFFSSKKVTNLSTKS